MTRKQIKFIAAMIDLLLICGAAICIILLLF